MDAELKRTECHFLCSVKSSDSRSKHVAVHWKRYREEDSMADLP